MVNKRDRSKEKVHSIRFDPDTYLQLSMAANKVKVPFATFIKSAALAYVSAMAQGEEITQALNPQEPEAAKQFLLEAIGDFKATVGNTISEKDDAIIKKLDRFDKLQRLMIYILLYHSREIPQEQKAAAQLSAKKRQEDLLKAFDREHAEG